MVWSGVYLYGGLINEIRVFRTREKAHTWFMDIVDGTGDPEVMCDEGDFEDSEFLMKYYDSLGRQDTEVLIEPVEIEG